MNDALIYFLKVNIAIALFYLFYRLFFAGDTFWKARRYYLLSSILVSLGYPFLSIENWMQKQEPVQRIIVNYASLPEITVSPRQTSIFTLENILLAIYFCVVVLLLVKFMIQLISILRVRMAGRLENIQGVAVIAVDKEISPFSFFNTIYINPALHDTQETSQILLHEQTHVGQMHSVDVMVSEMLTMIFWFNPAAWLLKREMRQNLEFLADNNVLKSGFDSRTYQYHLLQLAYQTPDLKLTNKFNVSPLKKRITMMNKQKTAKARILKYSLIVPLALALIVSSNAQNLVNKAKTALTQTQDSVNIKKKQVKFAPPQTQKNSVKFTPPTIVEDKSGIYSVVEEMPQYPGGENKLMEYVGTNIRYPVEAQKSNTEGNVFIKFIVDATGKVTNATVLKSTLTKSQKGKEVVVVGYGKEGTKPNSDLKQLALLEQEAIRVINAMPNWIPGKQKGQNVSVYYTIPIVFKLDNGNTSQDNGKLNIKTLNSGDAPLFVLDGKVITSSEASDIKNDNIKEINVLKDASATTAYGDKGKNGVIIITSNK